MNRIGETSARFAATALVALFAVIAPAGAQWYLGPSVLSGGTGHASGGNVCISSTVGQPSPVGRSSGGTHEMGHGFWRSLVHATAGTLGAMTLGIQRMPAEAILLLWNSVPGATNYDLYQSSIPHFVPAGAPAFTVSAPDTQLVLNNMTGIPDEHHFFRGVARNASQSSPPSNPTGEIEYWLGGGSLLLKGGGKQTPTACND